MGLLDKLTGTKRPAGDARPAPPEQVRTALLAVNRPDLPYGVRAGTAEEGVDLVGEWKIVDGQWRGLFANGGISRTYRVLMRLDPEKCEVRTVDKEFSVRWNAGVPQVGKSLSAFRGQSWEKTSAVQFGLNRRGQPTRNYAYTFQTKEIKEPLRAATTNCGWVWHALTFGKL
jgi:hypothetical protein